MAMAQQRMQQNAASAGSLGLTDGGSRAGHGGSSTSTDSQVHQGTQSGTGIGSHDAGNAHSQEPERTTGADSSGHAGNDQSLPQPSSNVNEGTQNALRRSAALGLVGSAASAFDAAKDIMEALRSKHTNLASELEVTVISLYLPVAFLPVRVTVRVINIYSFNAKIIPLLYVMMNL